MAQQYFRYKKIIKGWYHQAACWASTCHTFCSSSLLMHLGEQWKMSKSLGPYTHRQDQKEAPGFCLALAIMAIWGGI